MPQFPRSTVQAPCARRALILPMAIVTGALAVGGGRDVFAQDVAQPNPAAGFLARLGDRCGQAFEGVVVKAPETDAAFKPGNALVMHIRECRPQEVRVPIWMGTDASRTFVFTETPAGLDVRHDHRRSDGRAEPNTYYGGLAAHPPVAQEPPSATRQEFKRIDDEGVNTGWVAVLEENRFVYGTQRDGEWRHHFVFDLAQPVPVPGDPWGFAPLGSYPELPDAQEAFWSNLVGHCGQAFAGRLVRRPDGSEMFSGEEALVVHFRECGEERLGLPFHIDEDRSRTWVFTRTTAGLDLRHDHRLENGAPDPKSTWYGAPTWEDGSANRQEFLRETPADGVRTGWRVEILPGERYTYGTIRDGDWNFRADFDLTTPIDPPPAPWGH